MRFTRLFWGLAAAGWLATGAAPAVAGEPGKENQAPDGATTKQAATASPAEDSAQSGPPPGWLVVKRKDQVYWCAPRAPTGTRLAGKKTCMTPEQHQARQKRDKERLDEIQRSVQPIEEG